MGIVPASFRARWRGVDLDALDLDQLDRAGTPVIALDGDGRIMAMNDAAARWAGVAAWRARGRQLTRELGWRFGTAAVAQIGAFLGAEAASDALHVDAAGPRTGAEVALLRGAERIYVALS